MFCFYSFQGGKAVATSSGVIFGFIPWLLPALLIFFGIITISTRYVSVGSLFGATITFIASIILHLVGFDPILNKTIGYDFPLFCFLILILIFYRHRENINRLIHKEENKIKSRDIRKL